MLWRSESKEIFRPSNMNTAVRMTKMAKTSFLTAGDGLKCLSRSRRRVSVAFALRPFANTGRKTSTKSMVPTRVRAPTRPKSLNAPELIISRPRNAPTVVRLPTTRGVTCSLSALRLSGWYFRWSM